jgi:hypothetical protein
MPRRTVRVAGLSLGLLLQHDLPSALLPTWRTLAMSAVGSSPVVAVDQTQFPRYLPGTRSRKPYPHMILSPSLEAIYDRLQGIDLEEWGPGGWRYVCILFWNYEGYRHLRNSFDVSYWERWSRSSGEFWDLFLAGCHKGEPNPSEHRFLLTGEESPQHRPPFTSAEPPKLRSPFTGAEPSEHRFPLNSEESEFFIWDAEEAGLLAKEIADLAERHILSADLEHVVEPWTFTGPIDLAVVLAQRHESGIKGIDIEWATLRGAEIRAHDLPEAIGSYTEFHIDDDDTMTPEEILGDLPIPGSFKDKELPEIIRILKRITPRFIKIIMKADRPH